MAEGAPQRLLGDAQLAGGLVDATQFASASAASAAARSWTNRVPSAIEARPRSATRWRAVVPAKMPVRSSRACGPCNAASRHGPRTAQPAQTALAAAAWGTCPVSGKNSSGSTSAQAASRRQSRSPLAASTRGGGLASCWLVAASRSRSGAWPWRVRSCQVTCRT
jgi:hypothetical protein